MTDPVVREDRVILNHIELGVLSNLVLAGDRAGFYLAYYAMTDSSEAFLQAKIATLGEMVGGAAFAANRFLQDQLWRRRIVWWASGVLKVAVRMLRFFASAAVRPALPVDVGRATVRLLRVFDLRSRRPFHLPAIAR